MKPFINAEDLQDFGFRKYQAKNIIKEAKLIMAHKGFKLYNNKRLGLVPSQVVSHIVGIPLTKRSTDNNEK